MSYYGDDFYYEPSEFEIQIEEFKESLMRAVKEEYVGVMENLKKENKELQEIKANFEQIKRDYDNKKWELSREYEDLKLKVRRERLSQLMKECEVELYTVTSRGKKIPKCNKCDEERKIHFTTPSGRKTYEMCECDKSVQIYETHPILLSSFSIRNGEGNCWYKVRTDRNDEWLEYYEDSIYGKDLVTDEKQFVDIGYAYKSLFKTEELAQKFCDYKNSK
jgi:hypothetical protein